MSTPGGGFQVPEKSTAQYTAVLKDETGAVIPGSQLTTLTLTVYDVATNAGASPIAAAAILNSRNAQNVLGVNGGSVDVNGNVTMNLVPADNALVNPSAPTEVHCWLFQFTWAGGAKGGNHEVYVVIQRKAGV